MIRWFIRKRRPEPTPSWMKWLLIVFVLYAIATNMGKHSDGDRASPLQSITKDVRSSVNLSEYKDKIFPDADGELRMKDVEAGEGNSAICGQTVSLAYAAFFSDGKPAEQKADKASPLAFRIGEGKVMPALEQGVIGMRKGGKRSMLAPPGMVWRQDDAAEAPQRFDVELLSLAPALPDFESTPFRIADTASGARGLILCGQAVKAQVTVWSLDGKKIFSSKEPIAFTPGKSEVFLGLEQGVIGMRAGGMRTLVVPPAFQKPMGGNAPAVDIAFPKSQTVLVDVEAVIGN